MTAPAHHSAFTWIRSTPIASLNLEVQEFRHQATGAPHFHLAAADDQNVFLVALRTVPQDSTGVAHILEHTALCGSQKFPVRDPFFMMTRRSLNTFMNAFTSSDWTAYPFASCNRKDFDNLLQVYLDAVFFPNLDPLDFAQEGHRVEFAQPDDPSSELVFKGVVYNEMKGAMSSPISSLYQYLTEHLFPSVTYHYNSGGDPQVIPDLSFEQLKAFHAHHYHPSNAIFMTFGDIPAVTHQERFEALALNRFQALDLQIRVPDEQRYSTPQRVTERYSVDGAEGLTDKSHVVVGWLWGRSTDYDEVLTAQLLSDVLLDNSSSPLRHALETTELGSNPSPLCGLQDSSKEMIFACGLEGTNPELAVAVEQLVLDTLQRIATEGVPQEVVEAMLHQLEFSQREVGGDGQPYGLSLILHALAPAVHGADPVAALDLDSILNRLRVRVQDPEFIKALVRRLLLDNPHRVCLTMQPDPGLAAEREAAERARLAGLKQALDAKAQQQVVAQAQQLVERQMRQDDPELLPKVSLDDVPADLVIPEGEQSQVAGYPTTWYARGTNGIVYEELVVDLPALPPELSDRLPLLCSVLAEVGSGGRDYLSTQALHAAVTGGLHARSVVRAGVDDLTAGRGVLVLSGKALARNQAALADLLRETLESARFDELPRLRELVAQERAHSEQGVVGHGHSLAMMAATSSLSPSAALSHRWHGLVGIRQLKALDDELDDPAQLAVLAAQLQQLRDLLLKAPRQLLVVGEAEQRDTLLNSLGRSLTPQLLATGLSPFTPPTPSGTVNQGWTTSTQVNFCARAYPAVAVNHPDAAALMVLGGFLRNNFLHRAIREQGGAYGGGAGYDGDAGAFRFYSYRDPRLAETLADFDHAIDWLLTERHEWRVLEESILGVVSSIDKPGSPAGGAKRAFHSALHGRTPEQRRQLRQRILEVRLEELQRVAERYLRHGQAHTAVITDAGRLAAAGGLGLEAMRL